MLIRLMLLSGLLCSSVAQDSQQSASIKGIVTSQEKTRAVPGAQVEVVDVASGQSAGTTLTDENGDYLISGLLPGTYQVSVSMQGFAKRASNPVTLSAGQQLQIDLDLELASLQESVEVVGTRPQEVPETGTSQEMVEGGRIDVAPVRGDGFRALLPLLPGVIRSTDGRLIMKGGRPTQSSLVVNSSNNATDPSTGDFGFNLPVDAVESVNVLPNPYAAEYGRFSSGVTNILTRQGTNKWKFTVNNFLPRPKLRDGSIMGVGGFTPRFGVRGPLVQDKLFLAQTIQYRFLITDIPSLPELEADTRLESFASFTQLDANLSDRHALSTIISVFPRKLDFANLDTFNPRPVTANIHQRGYNIGFSERAVFSPSTVLESTVSYKRFDTDVFGQGLDEMFLTPDVNEGNYFNIQRRKTRTLQWVEQLSHLKEDWGGEHLFKFGVDVLRSSYDGLSDSRPVNIVRADGSLARQIRFGSPTSQRQRSTDVALFAQDRWRLNDHLLLELGARLDRDGVFEQTNLAPRFGFVWSVDGEGKNLFRGGAGLFYDRTPMTAAAFEDFETPSEQRFASDGATPLGPAQTFGLKLGQDLKTAYSFTWNLEYDRRVTEKVLFKANFLRRKGFHELVIDPIQGPEPLLHLDSRGRSKYWELELTTRYDLQQQEGGFFLLSYVRSRAEQDLNAFDKFYGNLRNPIIRPNEYSLADTDVAHRFVFQGTFHLPGKWIFSPVVEVRSGFPYSTINEERNFIGPRNRSGRFPWLQTLDIDIQKWFKIWKWNTRIGFRVFNAFNTFNPRDVQGNIDASLFGAFFNTTERIFGGTFQIEN